jgi:uncharacterized protein (UPF0335 family)
MGFRDGEIDFAGQSYQQLCRAAGNGWDVNLVSKILSKIKKLDSANSSPVERRARQLAAL